MIPRISQKKADDIRKEIKSGARMIEIARREKLPYDLIKDIKYERAYYEFKKKNYKVRMNHE
jgi:hypothetical protein